MAVIASPPDRRAFLLRVLRLGSASAATLGLGAYLSGRSTRPGEEVASQVSLDHRVADRPDLPELAVARGESAAPAALVRKVIEDMGGMGRFVARGKTVVIKPNIAWDRLPEHAATTNPEVVAELVRLCRAAGAGSVIVTDVSCNEAEACFDRSGIAAAARAAGAEVVLPQTRFFKRVDLGGQVLREWLVLEPFLEADTLINVPIAKHHSLTGVTLGNGTLTAASLQAGKLTGCRGSLTLGSTSSVTTTVRIALPVTANPTASYYAFAGWVYLLDSSAPARKYRVPVSGSGVDFLISDLDYVTVNATTPWTWANGDQIMWEFFYEAA